MKRTGLFGMFVVAAMLMSGGCSRAENANTSGSRPADGVAVGTGGAGATLKDDGEFVQDVANKNLAEIELSRLALNKATHPEVKAYAQMMVQEHGAAENTLKGAIAGQSIQLPTALDDKHREPVEELSGKQGADFDRDYLEAMIESHQDLAAKLESRLDVQSLADWKTAAAARTHNQAMPQPHAAMADVKVRPIASDNAVTSKINQWAADTYPVAQKHLDAARTLENTIKKRSTN
jgi:putative membrane protein